MENCCFFFHPLPPMAAASSVLKPANPARALGAPSDAELNRIQPNVKRPFDLSQKMKKRSLLTSIEQTCSQHHGHERRRQLSSDFLSLPKKKDLSFLFLFPFVCSQLSYLADKEAHGEPREARRNVYGAAPGKVDSSDLTRHCSEIAGQIQT